MKLMGHNSQERGFSFTELLIVIGAAIVIIGMIVPAVSRARDYYRLANATDEIASLLEYARSEAVKRDSTATVTFSAAGTYSVRYNDSGTMVEKTFYLPEGVSLLVQPGSAAPAIQFFASGKATVTPAGSNIVLRNSTGTRTLSISVAGNITRG